VIFGEIPSAEAEGVRLAHTLKLPQLTLKKGRVLSATDVATLVASSVARIVGARVGADEVDEDQAAAAAAALVAGDHVVAKPPYTGRCNLYARAAGLLKVDGDCVTRLNRVSETLTIATLPPWTVVAKDQRIATVKVIPFAVANQVIADWRAATGVAPPLTLLPFRPRRTALILSVSPSTGERQIDMASAASRTRVESLGSKLALELRCAHEVHALRQSIAQALAAGCDLLLILGATISKDRADIVPTAIAAAGGAIEHFGMPVEPGNMLLTARIGQVPVLNLPGCARSRAPNGIDFVLPRLMADLPVTGADIMAMGVGGLIHAVEDDEAPPEAAQEAPPSMSPPRIAVLVLAAGRSTRMGPRNKLLCEIDGVPLVRRAVNAACASRAAQILVVTGHEAAGVAAALVDRPVSVVHNPDHALGMSTSLRCGLRALPTDTDAVIVMLADMPRLTGEDVDRLICAFDPAAPAVLVPEYNGRRGNPILWPRGYFAEMMSIVGDTGARALLEQHADAVRPVPFADNGIFDDIDTPEQLQLAGTPEPKRS